MNRPILFSVAASILSILVICGFPNANANAVEILTVTPADNLQSVLDRAGQIAGDVEIRIAQGVYAGSFSYDNARINVSEQRLTISGGWNANFNEKTNPREAIDNESLKTILKGVPNGGTVLQIQNWDDFRNISVIIDGLQIQDGAVDNPDLSVAGLLIALTDDAITLKNSIIINNKYSGGYGVGGAKINSHGAVLIENNTILGNASPYYGGGLVIGGETTATIKSNMISLNVSQEGAGGVWIHTNVVSVTMIENTICNNQSAFAAGVLIYRDDDKEGLTSVSLSGNVIYENIATSGGGGVACFRTTGDISRNTLRNNIAENGGALHIERSELTISENNILDNIANRDGGGLHTDNSGGNIARNVVRDNRAGYDGGGIYYRESRSVIEKNYIENNVCNNWGGGICVYVSSGLIQNNIIAGNYAGEHGGGMSFFNGSDAFTINNTIYGNAAFRSGGGIYSDQGETSTVATVANTLLWGNDPQQLETDADSTAIMVSTSNIDQDGFVGVNGNIRQNPHLHEIAQGGYHLSSNSSLGGGSTANAPNDDIDGEKRDPGRIDIGADAYNSAAPPVNQSPVAEIEASKVESASHMDITLDGTKSYDPDGTIGSYTWIQLPGAAANLTNLDTATTKFSVDSTQAAEIFRFTLTVTDDQGKTGRRTIFIKPDELGDAPPPITPPTVDKKPVLKQPSDGYAQPGLTVRLSIETPPAAYGYHRAEFWIRRVDKRNDPFMVELSNTEQALLNLQPGLKYAWKARYLDANGAPGDWSEEWSFFTGEMQRAEFKMEPGSNKADYRMISFPFWAKYPEIETILGAAARPLMEVDIMVGAYYPADPGYRGYNDGMLTQPGKAFWFLARNGFTISFEGVPTSAQAEVETPLEKGRDGWNMIASPYHSGFDWEKVVVVDYGQQPPTEIAVMDMTGAGPIETCLWAWVNGDYETSGYMAPGTGYWVKVLKENISLKFPQGGMVRSQPKASGAETKGSGSCDSPPAPIRSLNEKPIKDSIDGCFIETVRH